MPAITEQAEANKKQSLTAAILDAIAKEVNAVITIGDKDVISQKNQDVALPKQTTPASLLPGGKNTSLIVLGIFALIWVRILTLK